MRHYGIHVLAVTLLTLSFPILTLAAGGTSIVATEGQDAYVNPSWPKGVDALVNHALRTTGWNSWFSEWPNDVNQYAFKANSTADINTLIEKLAAIKTDLRQVRLSYLAEPRGLGWVTILPEENGIPVIFSIGDQSRIDQWYAHVRKPFGVMEFTTAPVAVPPTLTIFVQHKAVKLEELKIPSGIEVTSGYVPTVFHRSNTKLEQEQEKKPKTSDSKTKPEDPAAQAIEERIQKFIERRKVQAEE